MKEIQLEFQTKYVGVNDAKAKPPTYEKLSSELLTEQAGYVPPKIQIENMILAGRRLNEARLNQFDFPNEESIDENASDPTRSGNFDLADASQMYFDAVERLSAQEATAEASKMAVKPSQNAQEGSGEPKKSPEGVNPKD